MVQQNITSASIKNAQNQKLLLAKNYVEQELETQGYRGRIKYDMTNKALVQYRTKEGTIAVIKEGKLHIFEMPVKKFKGALPLETNPVDMDSIRTEKATCCKRCHQWKKTANITRCPCGGYLVPRKRFSVDAVESWDEEVLEIEFAKKDIILAKKTDRVLAHKPKRSTPKGITANLSGMYAVDTPLDTHKEELLLVTDGEDVRTIRVRPISSCSLIFVAAIDSGISDEQKFEILSECRKDDSEDRQFLSETDRFVREHIPQKAKNMVDSWNEPSYPFKLGRKGKTSKRATRSLKRMDKSHASEKTSLKNGKKPQFFASSVPAAQTLKNESK